MAEQLAKIFRILLYSSGVFTVDEKVSSLYFFNYFSSNYPPPPEGARRGQRKDGENHTSTENTGVNVEFTFWSYWSVISAASVTCWKAVECALHMTRVSVARVDQVGHTFVSPR